MEDIATSDTKGINMSLRPLIGITLDLPESNDHNKYAAFPWYALRKNYADAVIEAGGIPICIPYVNKVASEELIDIIDGLIIPGGDMDIPPHLYNQIILSDKIKLNEERTNFELHLLKLAKNKNLPFLGICNGMQLLNVSCGGSLIQHIPDYVKSAIVHEQPSPKHVPSHIIYINKDTMLNIFAENHDQVRVNSTHHQAIDQIGSGLIVSAVAEDGIIEAIESLEFKFMIGVEWHPEYLSSNPLDINLFKGLIKAASKK